MNWLDLVIILVLLVSLIVGLLQGFVRTLLSLIGVVVGVLLASRYYTQLAGLLKFIPSTSAANIIAFAIILLAVLILAALIGSVLKSILAAIKLGCVDRLAGGVLGLFLGVLFVGAILAAIVKFFGQGAATESAIARILLDRFPFILGLLPGQFDSIRGFFR